MAKPTLADNISNDTTNALTLTMCTSGIDDFWAWHFEHKGVFSVRSAYLMLVDTKIIWENGLEGVEGSSNTSEISKAWSNIWSLSVPSKLKLFVWRLAHQSLPSADVLQHRNMCTNSTCALCGCVDSWCHSLLECTIARCTWALSEECLTFSPQIERGGEGWR